MWRYDTDWESMLNQCAGIDINNKTLEEGLTDILSKGTDSIFKTINHKSFKHNPGYYYPRIWRKGSLEKNFEALGEPTSDNKVLTQDVTSAVILIKKLLVIFETIEAHPNNLSVYGNEIRNLLLLCCIEVESSFSGILKANDYQEARWSTKDYVKLLEPIDLTKYSVNFELYPDLPVFSPFKNWNSDRPTQSLIWYAAYNKTKHNREQELNSATLFHAIEAISAVVLLIYAQYGPNHKFWLDGVFTSLTVKKSEFIDVKKIYIPHNSDKALRTDWKEMKMNF